MKTIILAGLMLVSLASPAMAQTAPSGSQAIPEDYLKKDYDACMGGYTAQQDPGRGQYCQCVHDKLKTWTMDDYGNAATQVQQSGNNVSNLPGKVQDIAQACMQAAGH